MAGAANRVGALTVAGLAAVRPLARSRLQAVRFRLDSISIGFCMAISRCYRVVAGTA
jgi:hypothetical protein